MLAKGKCLQKYADRISMPSSHCPQGELGAPTAASHSSPWQSPRLDKRSNADSLPESREPALTVHSLSYVRGRALEARDVSHPCANNYINILRCVLDPGWQPFSPLGLGSVVMPTVILFPRLRAMATDPLGPPPLVTRFFQRRDAKQRRTQNASWKSAHSPMMGWGETDTCTSASILLEGGDGRFVQRHSVARFQKGTLLRKWRSQRIVRDFLNQ